MFSESAHVQFVDDAARVGVFQREVAFPIVGTRIDDDAFHGARTIIAGLRSSVAIIVIADHHAAPIRIEQHFAGIEAKAIVRLKRAVSAIAIQLPGAQTGHEDVPVVECFVALRIELNDAAGPGDVHFVEEEQFQRRAVFGEDAKVHAVRISCRADGITTASESIGHGTPVEFSIARVSCTRIH